jgi:hypothetical protein
MSFCKKSIEIIHIFLSVIRAGGPLDNMPGKAYTLLKNKILLCAEKNTKYSRLIPRLNGFDLPLRPLW